MTLRRRSAEKNWFRAIPVKTALEGSAGDQIIRLFAAQDYLDSLGSKQDLLKAILQKINLEIIPQPEQTKSAVTTKEMRIQVTLHPATLAVLPLLDGQTILQKAIEQTFPQGIPPDDVRQNVLDDVEMLIQLGMVIPQGF